MQFPSLVRTVASLLLALCSALAAAQTPQGTAFTYQGDLRQGGAPVTASTDMMFELFDAASNGNPIGTVQDFTAASGKPVQVQNGLFAVTLDFGALAFAGSVSDERYLKITINGVVLAPRTKIENAPYALQSRRAELAYTVANASIGSAQVVPAQVQLRVSGNCAAGSSIQGINQNGTVSCQSGGAGTVTSVASGTGLTGGPITGSGTLAIANGGVGLPQINTAQVQARVTGSCSAGQKALAVNADGSLACAPDANSGGTLTGVTAGAGLAGGGASGNPALSIDTSAASAGQALTYTGSGLAWQQPNPYVHMVIVHPIGTALQNGAALKSALAAIAIVGLDQWILHLESGQYDVGSSPLVLRSGVDLEGAGRRITTIAGTNSLSQDCSSYLGANVSATIINPGGSEIHDVSVENYVSNGASPYAIGICAGAYTHVSRAWIFANGGATNSVGYAVGQGGIGSTMSDVQISMSGCGAIGVRYHPGSGEYDGTMSIKDVNIDDAGGAVPCDSSAIVVAALTSTTGLDVDTSVLSADSYAVRVFGNQIGIGSVRITGSRLSSRTALPVFDSGLGGVLTCAVSSFTFPPTTKNKFLENSCNL